MSEITHYNDENGHDELNIVMIGVVLRYLSRLVLIVESYMEGCEDRIFCKCCVFFWRPSISSGFGCWATHTRSNTMHKEYIQATWNADVSTARILLETKEKRKSDDGAYKAQFKQKRKRSEKSMQPDLKQSNRKVKTANQVRLTVLVLRSGSQKGT